MSDNLPEGFKKVAEIKATELTMRDSAGDPLIVFTGVDLNIDMNLTKVKNEADLDFYAWQVAQEIKKWAKGRLAEIVEELKVQETQQ